MLPKGVSVQHKDGIVAVKGPKGELSTHVLDIVNITIEGEEVTVTRTNDHAAQRSAHGLTRTLINNMVLGVTDGFQRKLEIVGVGFRAEMRGKALQLNLGYSHPIIFFPPDTIELSAPTATTVTVVGIDKQLVGQVAAKIRSLRPPEPYKGKGVKYEGEQIRRKAGKSAGK